MLLQSLAVLAGPGCREALGREDLFQHEIAVLHDVHFDGQTRGVQDGAHVRRTAAETPQHTGTGFHGESTHGASSKRHWARDSALLGIAGDFSGRARKRQGWGYPHSNDRVGTRIAIHLGRVMGSDGNVEPGVRLS